MDFTDSDNQRLIRILEVYKQLPENVYKEELKRVLKQEVPSAEFLNKWKELFPEIDFFSCVSWIR